jgi:magnesium-protoporphyrin O-methyltransferase
VLDIGAGVGTMTFELLKHGATAAVMADAAPAFLRSAREEAERTGVRDQIGFEQGNFVETSDHIAAADVVVLDRAVCCYPDWKSLLDRAASRCRRVLGLSYPRNRADVRFMIGFENLRRRLAKDDFRAFVHSPAEMHEALQASGLERVSRARTIAWHVDVYARRPSA